jgi:Uma2 family endonuclease
MVTHAPPVQADGPAMSFEEYLEAYDGVHAEWVEGRVYVMSPGNEPQGRLSRFLAAIIQYWAEANGGLGETYLNAYPVRLNEQTAREPDVFFIRKEHAERALGTFVQGAVDLVIEVASPSTRAVDRGVKYYEYEQAGVPEYWLVDPLRERVEAYRLGSGGMYEPVALGSPLVLQSEVALPGMWIPAEWLWQNPLPRMSDVFETWRTSPGQENRS